MRCCAGDNIQESFSELVALVRTHGVSDTEDPLQHRPKKSFFASLCTLL